MDVKVLGQSGFGVAPFLNVNLNFAVVDSNLIFAVAGSDFTVSVLDFNLRIGVTEVIGTLVA